MKEINIKRRLIEERISYVAEYFFTKQLQTLV